MSTALMLAEALLFELAINSCVSTHDWVLYYNYSNYVVPGIVYNAEGTVLAFGFRRFDAYILELGLEARDIVRSLSEDAGWNSRARFVVRYHGDVAEVLSILVGYYVYNVVVVSGEVAYTYFPYEHEDFNSTRVDLRAVDEKSWFPTKLPKSWRNSTLSALAKVLSPFVISVPARTGMELLLLYYVLLPRLGAKLRVEETELSYGVRYSNGSYDGATGLFQQLNLDFAVGFFHTREIECLVDFDVTSTYLVDDVIWVVPRATRSPYWRNLLQIFPGTVWCYLFITLLTSSIAWCLVPKLSLFEHLHFKVPRNSLLVPLRFLLDQVDPATPKTVHLKILFVTTWLFVLALSTLWNAYLLYFLSRPNFNRQISTIDDIMNHNLKVNVPPGILRLYDGKFGDYLLNNSPGTASTPFLQQVAEVVHGTTATIMTKSMYQYYWPKFVDHTGNSAMFPLEKIVVTDYVVIFVKKGCPIFERIDELLRMAVQGGLVRYFNKKVVHETMLENSAQSQVGKFENRVLTLEQMLGAFGLQAIGFCIATIVFGFEKIFHWRKCQHFKECRL